MKRIGLWLTLITLVSLLASCGTPAATTEPQKVTVKETVIIQGTVQTVVREVTSVVEVEKVVTATPEPEKVPAVGGTLVYALSAEPESLDPQKSTSGVAVAVADKIGAALLTRDPATGELVPYLAESWKLLEDGKSYEFKLKKGIKFHDGTPLTAQDYAWTFQRALDPATMSMVTGAALTGLQSVEAVDDYTLRFNMAMPQAYLLGNLTQAAYFQPLLKSEVEKWGDDYGRHPMSVGPYKFVEWKTAEKITLERNPDFSWGPAYAHGGAPYIERIEFPIIPEYSTRLAGLESGEIDFAYIETKDLERMKETGKFQIVDALTEGIWPGLFINNEKPPFTDVRVRQAFSMAVDRDAMIKIIELGYAVPQYGPLSPGTRGYWPGAEYVGFHYNLDKAKALMAEAGYTPGSDGILQKDGKPLSLTLNLSPYTGRETKIAEILQEQLSALGVQVKIEQVEEGILATKTVSGDYEMAVSGNGWPDTGLLFVMYHSSMIGSLNRLRVADPTLDPMMLAMGFSSDPKVTEEMGNQVQKYITEQAFIIPIYASQSFAVVSNRVQGVVAPSLNGIPVPQFYDAFIETTTE